jgi:hypothetical protein
MTMTHRRWLSCGSAIAVLAAVAILAAAEDSLRIVPVVQGDDVLVSFELSDALTPDVHEAILSGLQTSFTYDVELRRVGFLWFDRTVARVIASTSDQYDNLTRRHSLSRVVNGHIEEASVTEDASLVARFLTAFARLPLCKTSELDPSHDYYVRVSVQSRPRGGSFFGFANSIIGYSKFTFVP